MIILASHDRIKKVEIYRNKSVGKGVQINKVSASANVSSRLVVTEKIKGFFWPLPTNAQLVAFLGVLPRDIL